MLNFSFALIKIQYHNPSIAQPTRCHAQRHGVDFTPVNAPQGK